MPRIPGAAVTTAGMAFTIRMAYGGRQSCGGVAFCLCAGSGDDVGTRLGER